MGAAAAYELSRYNCRVLVLEAKNDVANVTTKANSAILHAGYDPTPGALMAETNVRGVPLAKEVCEKLDVEREEIGSLVLAFGEEDERHLEKLNQRQRETCPASELVVGMQCGGSDAFSGVTANPAVGYASDLLVRCGATVMFSDCLLYTSPSPRD